MTVDVHSSPRNTVRVGDFRNANIGAIVGFTTVFVAVASAGIVGGIGVWTSIGLGVWLGFWGGGGFGFMMGGAVPSRSERKWRR